MIFLKQHFLVVVVKISLYDERAARYHYMCENGNRVRWMIKTSSHTRCFLRILTHRRRLSLSSKVSYKVTRTLCVQRAEQGLSRKFHSQIRRMFTYKSQHKAEKREKLCHCLFRRRRNSVAKNQCQWHLPTFLFLLCEL